jgi:hypothetical protein
MNPMDVEALLKALGDDRSVEDLCTYFNVRAGGPPLYTGAKFELLNDGGSRDEVRDKITPWDLLAVQCLGLTVPTSVALELIEGQLGEELGTLLREVPTNVALGEADADKHVRDGSPANQAWRILEAQDDVGWVIAGKLMARKRPHLIPVWDNVVRCAFGRPRNAWLWLDGLLRQHDSGLKEQLDELHHAAQLPELVSRIRVLDVVIWMRHHPVHRSTKCPGLGTPSALMET